MKLNRQEKEIVRRKFCAYCIKVLHGEALNYLDELERKRKREVNFLNFYRKIWMLCIAVMIMIWQRILPLWADRFQSVMNGYAKH